MTVSAIHRPVPGEAPGELGPNNFTAGSDLTLKCSVEGHSGGLGYNWSVNSNPSTPGCAAGRCDIDTMSNMAVMSIGSSSTLVVGTFSLYSYYAGNYTCTASEDGRSASENSDVFLVKVFGEYLASFHLPSQSRINVTFQVLEYMLFLLILRYHQVSYPAMD